MMYIETENGSVCPPAGEVEILIADEEPIVRYALTQLLNVQQGFFVVSQSADFNDCCHKLVVLNPDLVILDLKLPGLSGAELIDRLYEFKTQARVIVFTSCLDDFLLAETINAGVNGYLTKKLEPDALVATVHSKNHSGLPPLVKIHTLKKQIREPKFKSSEMDKRVNFHNAFFVVIEDTEFSRVVH